MKASSKYSYGATLLVVVLHLCQRYECATPGRGRAGASDPGRYPSTNSPPAWAINSIDRLGTSVLSDIFKAVGPSHNIVICPVGIWAILMMLVEASQGKTQEEIRTVLGLREISQVQLAFERLRKALEINGEETEFAMVNTLLSSQNVPPNINYSKLIEKKYGGKIFSMDLNKPAEVEKAVNGWAAEATRNRINRIITKNDVSQLNFLLGNGAFFKARWKYPFNASLTTTDQFKDDSGKIINEVSMMTDTLPLQYTYNNRLSSQIVEIPYANDIVSMYVILPSQKIRFGEALSRLKNMTMNEILAEGMELQEVELLLPRFNIESEWTLNSILSQMGIIRVFSPANAELPMFSPDVYVSRINHFAEIENTEEGTVASSVSTAIISLKTQKVRFHANRPFVYLIVDKKSKIILFAGTVSSPKRW